MIPGDQLDARRYTWPGAWLSTQLSNVLDPEVLRDRLEHEARRHARYLTGFGVVRLCPLGEEARVALEEAVVTETRCTDAVALLPDGTFAVLLTHADDDACRTVATRLVDVVCELLGDDHTRDCVRVGLASAGQRRLDAEEVWEASQRGLAWRATLQS